MIYDELIIKNLYKDEQCKSGLSWIKYLETLSEDKQIECINSCQTEFLKNDWLNIFNLAIFDKLCIKHPHFNVYKFIIEENQHLMYENIKLRDYLYSMINLLNQNFDSLTHFCHLINENMHNELPEPSFNSFG
jgi:hypothetical protein